jgi:hypothetical protein
VDTVGLEPTTFGLKARCTACLCYVSVVFLVHTAGVEPATTRLSAGALTARTSVDGAPRKD